MDIQIEVVDEEEKPGIFDAVGYADCHMGFNTHGILPEFRLGDSRNTRGVLHKAGSDSVAQFLH